MSWRFKWEPRDLWVGIYWDTSGIWLHIYVCIIPCLPLHVTFQRRGTGGHVYDRVISSVARSEPKPTTPKPPTKS